MSNDMWRLDFLGIVVVEVFGFFIVEFMFLEFRNIGILVKAVISCVWAFFWLSFFRFYYF